MEAANYVIENKDGPDYQVGKENDFFLCFNIKI